MSACVRMVNIDYGILFLLLVGPSASARQSFHARYGETSP